MTILTDFSADAIDAAVIANMLLSVDNAVKIPGAELYKGDDMVRAVVPSVPSPMLNLVAKTRFDGNIDDKIKEAMAVFTKRNIPFLWQIEPSTQPDNLGDRLIEHGMQFLGENPVLVVDTDSINEAPKLPQGYEIKHVSNDDLLGTFGDIFGIGFQIPSFVVDTMLLMYKDYAPDTNLINYIGYLDGEAVSVGTIIFGAGVAGFYSGTVLESARGKGIGTANALHRIAVAKERGYRIGFMVSGGNAYNLYKRLGFKDYTPLERYMWMPEQPGDDVS